ncbi:MAG: glycosyltransferase family 39 protein, partial [Elusimicrobiota bacterium]|nr:glycosyltransferase family 39 protein [Elusimicrobiota bacterium]
MRFASYFWAINIATAIFRLLLIIFSKPALFADEANLWLYSKFVNLSFIDHPPLAAFIIKISTAVFGDNLFALRFPSVLFLFLSMWFLYAAAKKLFDERTAFFAFLIINIIPFFSLPFYLSATYDYAVLFFWAISFLLFAKIIQTNNKNLWYPLGAALGLALLAGYSTAMILLSIFLFLAFAKDHRRWLLRKEPYFAVLIAGIIFIPVLFWNIENGWAGFWFGQNSQLLGGNINIEPKRFGAFVLKQIFNVSPLIFAILWASVFVGFKKMFAKENENIRLIIFFILPPLIMFNLSAFVLKNTNFQISAGYFFLSMIAAWMIFKFWKSRAFKIFIVSSILFSVGYAGFFSGQIFKGTFPTIGEVNLSQKTEPYGWYEIAGEIRKLSDNYPTQSKPFIFT